MTSRHFLHWGSRKAPWDASLSSTTYNRFAIKEAIVVYFMHSKGSRVFIKMHKKQPYTQATFPVCSNQVSMDSSTVDIVLTQRELSPCTLVLRLMWVWSCLCWAVHSSQVALNQAVGDQPILAWHANDSVWRQVLRPQHQCTPWEITAEYLLVSRETSATTIPF